MEDTTRNFIFADVLNSANPSLQWHTSSRVGGQLADLGDGRELAVVVQPFNLKLTLGPAGDGGLDHFWEYETLAALIFSVSMWDGEQVGPGWIRTSYGAKRRGWFRRRRDSNPASEIEAP